MSVTNKIKIPDRDIEKAIKEVEKIAEEGKKGNFEIYEREIGYNDIGQLKEGVRYIDQNSSGDKRIVQRIGNDLYSVPLTIIDR